MRKVISNNGIAKDSLPSTYENYQMIRQKQQAALEGSNSVLKNSNIYSNLTKIISFEWAGDNSQNTKSLEYYLNIYFHKIKSISSGIANKKNDMVFLNNSGVENLPFNCKEHIFSTMETEKIKNILKKKIVFQNISEEILSVIVSEMILVSIPQGKIIYDLYDDGNFFYIIGKGKIQGSGKYIWKERIKDNVGKEKIVEREMEGIFSNEKIQFIQKEMNEKNKK